MQAIPAEDKDIGDILKECKDLMRQKASIHDLIKDYQFSLKKAR